MRQTVALFIDAYRQLNSKKLFWITLILSGFGAGAFGLVGINEEGLRVLVWDIPTPLFTTKLIPEETFYKTLFTSLGMFWLAWVATILALVSTAGMIPDFTASGSIDLVLSKPIRRLRVFLTKYVMGLLFMALQVTVFSVASFLVIGIRGGAWEPALLLAIPVVVCFFSYLFSVCAVLGLLTRSTIASLLLTLLIWLFIFAIHGVETGLLWDVVTKEQQVATLQRDIATREKRLADMHAEPAVEEPASTNVNASSSAIQRMSQLLERRREQLVEFQDVLKTRHTIHRIVWGIKTALPKTSETIGLLERWLIDLAELPEMEDESEPPPLLIVASSNKVPVDQPAVQKELVERSRERSVLWVVGTSLLFETVVLAFGGWVFCRRDF